MNEPIGIFDSGMGGLTVLDAVRKRLPGENIIYFGDTAHLPYGNKSPESIIKYSLSIADFFREKGVKLMVVACNTASVYSLGILKEKMDFPVIGVVESGVEAAVDSAKDAIGIIGTYGTIKSGVYQKQIKEKKRDVRIYPKACPLFVPLVEEGWIEHEVTELIAGIYLSDIRDSIEALILACTHYPLIKGVISRVVGRDVRIIDSAMEVAKAVEKTMQESGLSGDSSGTAASDFYVSDAPELFREKSSLFLGRGIETVKKIEI
ncbi:MAG: glutamate racemase [Elusimicrobia bacterium]|nr:glutamate racemase [Elusimicrobiota bacterium]